MFLVDHYPCVYVPSYLTHWYVTQRYIRPLSLIGDDGMGHRECRKPLHASPACEVLSSFFFFGLLLFGGNGGV